MTVKRCHPFSLSLVLFWVASEFEPIPADFGHLLGFFFFLLFAHQSQTCKKKLSKLKFSKIYHYYVDLYCAAPFDIHKDTFKLVYAEKTNMGEGTDLKVLLV